MEQNKLLYFYLSIFLAIGQTDISTYVYKDDTLPNTQIAIDIREDIEFVLFRLTIDE